MAPAGERRVDRTRRRRADIVEAAIHVFGELGYEGASLRGVAQQLNITKGDLAYYFNKKDDLLDVIVGRLHDDFLTLSDYWDTSAESPVSALRDAIRAHVLLVAANIEETRISYDDFRFLSLARSGVRNSASATAASA